MATKTLKGLLFTATFSSLLVLPAHAQDPPMRVADLNYVQGNISMQPAGAPDWSPAVVNRPFTSGDNLWVDADSQAELHLNDAVVRVGPQSSIGFMALDDHFVQIRFTQGQFILRVRRPAPGETFEVDTPNAAITIVRGGEYRFNADPDSATTFVVARHGEAEVTGGGQAFTLSQGNSAQLTGTDQLTYNVQYAPGPDGFDTWSEQRDARERQLMAARYLPPSVIGYEELDNYGTWRDTPGYGAVWYPSVDANWAPYSVGHWAWIDPWGWTWVDDQPWGFAPSHYGRWAYFGGSWGWVPGPLLLVGGVAPSIVPAYAPALVAFIGGGGFGLSLSIGGPAVGWVPLGPGELYAPAYQVSPNYFRTVNVSSTVVVNQVNITNVYNTVYVNKTAGAQVNQRFANMNAPHAVTAVPQNSFASGRPVNPSRNAGVVVPSNQISQIRPTVALPVSPTKQALAPLAGTRPAPQPPARAVSAPVVAKVTPVNNRPVFQSSTPGTVSPVTRTQAPAPPVRIAPPARVVTPPVQAAGPRPPQNMPPPNTNRPPAQPPQNTPPPNTYRPPAQPQNTPPPNTYRPPAQPQNTPPPNTYRPPEQPQNTPPPNTYRPPAQPQSTPPPANRPPQNTPPPANRPPQNPPPATYRPPQNNAPAQPPKQPPKPKKPEEEKPKE